jgi:IS4 transposase
VDDPRDATCIPVRVIEYTVSDSKNAETIRVITSILDPFDIPAPELADAYHHRWEYEQSLREIKSDLIGTEGLLRSRKPDLARQELWGLFLAHYAIHALMVEAAETIDYQPNRLSFINAVRVTRRQITDQAAFSPLSTS